MKPRTCLDRFNRWAFIWTSAVTLLGAPWSTSAADPFAEGVRTTEPRTPAEQQRSFHLPPGFGIQLVAAEPDLRKPMNLAFDARGRLWFTESREYPFAAKPGETPRDTIRVASDFDANGRARTVTTFATNLNIPIGIYPYQNGCIAWSISNIWFFQDSDGDGKADKRAALYGPFDHSRDTHGNQASFRRGFDGWLYATHGFNNDSHVKGRDGSEVHLNSGNTYRMRLDGSRIEHYTHGQVNPFGLAFDELGNLFSSDCHSEPIYQLLAGGTYPSFGKPHDGLGFAPKMMEKSRGTTAIDGISCYADDLWPAEFRGNLFIGDVLASRVLRERTVDAGSTKVGKAAPDFVTTDDPWFRPVDTQLGPDGALYIADFYNRIIGHYEVPLNHPGRDRERGRIWRVVYKGTDGKAPQRPLALASDLDGLIKELASPSLTRRMLAMNALADRFGKDAAPQLARALDAFQNEFQQVHILWLLHRFDAITPKQLRQAAASKVVLARVHAQRIATDMFHQSSLGGRPVNTTTAHQVATEGLKDHNALVQRCAVEAMGKNLLLDASVPRLLLDLRARVAAADTHSLYVVRKALRDQLKHERVFQTVLAEQLSERDERTIADVCPGITNAAAGSFLLAFAKKYPVERATLGDYLKHAARYAPADGLDALGQFARVKFADDTDTQLALFKSVQQGLAQRGAALSPGLQSWGAELVGQLLAAVDDTALAWANTPLDGVKDTSNPWFVQKRVSADGDKTATFLCSLPPGGEALTGVLRSKPFTIPAKLSFWLAGHDGFPDKPAQKRNAVRLRLDETKEVVAETWPPRNDTAQQVTWDLSRHAGKTGVVEVTDGDTGGAYAWLAVGRFDPPVAAVPKADPSGIAQRQVAAADLAGKLRLASAESRLAAIFQNKAGDADARAASARALLVLNAKGHLASVTPILNDATASVTFRDKLGQAIAEQNSAETRAILVEALRAAPQRLQVKLAAALAGNSAGAEALLQAVTDGQASPRLLLERAVKDKLAAAKPANAAARVERLTKGLSPASGEVEKLIEQRRTAYPSARASVTEGAALYTKHCAVCHNLGGQGGNVGPQLDGIGLRGLERLCEDVLDPNRNVDRAFRNTLLALKDGDVTSGLFRREEGELLVLADSTGKEITVAKKDVKERRESDTSLMPENFGEILSPADFNHLIAFLLSKSGKPAGQ